MNNKILEIHLATYLQLPKPEKLAHLRDIFIRSMQTKEEKQKKYYEGFISNVSFYDEETYLEFANEKIDDFKISFNSRDDWRLYRENMEIIQEIDQIKILLGEEDENKIVQFMRPIAMFLKWGPEPKDSHEYAQLWRYREIYGAIWQELEKRNLKIDILPKIIFFKNF